MGGHHFHGLEIAIRSFSGARAVRVVHPSRQLIGEHRHDWPILTIPALGGYDECFDGGQFGVGGPAAVLHPAGRCHANDIHALGMETFSLEFDQQWLASAGFHFRFDQTRHWLGGTIAIEARLLAGRWTVPDATESELCLATGNFLMSAFACEENEAPPWLARLQALLDQEEPVATAELARQMDMHPAWLARAYRSAVGEGLHETVRRKRVERAMHLLRLTDSPIAEIAVASGFCDQSHLNRVVQQLAGRTPLQVRGERISLSQLAA